MPSDHQAEIKHPLSCRCDACMDEAFGPLNQIPTDLMSEEEVREIAQVVQFVQDEHAATTRRVRIDFHTNI